VAEGQIQAEVSRNAYEHERRLQRGDIKKVGVNLFRDAETAERAVEYHPYRSEEAAAQMGRLARIRRERDGAAVTAALAAVRTAAIERRNVMPSVMTAVRTYATVGEISGVLRGVFGTYEERVRW